MKELITVGLCLITFGALLLYYGYRMTIRKKASNVLIEMALSLVKKGIVITGFLSILVAEWCILFVLIPSSPKETDLNMDNLYKTMSGYHYGDETATIVLEEKISLRDPQIRIIMLQKPWQEQIFSQYTTWHIYSFNPYIDVGYPVLYVYRPLKKGGDNK